MRAGLLTDADIRRLAAGADQQYFFDFSEISAESFEPLFRTLKVFARKSAEAIGFSCDRLASGDPLPAFVGSSIAQKKADYLNRMVELLCSVIPKSQRLASVQFSNLAISPEQLARLSNAFGKSKGLRMVRFANVELKDDGLRAVLADLNPNTLESVEITDCGITTFATPDILKFIGRRLKIGTGLKAFVVSTSEISALDRQRIAAALSGVQVRPPADPDSSDGDSDSDELNSMGVDQTDIITHLKDENDLLVEQIQVLRQLVQGARDADALFIVGPRAPDFQLYMNDVERRLAALDPGHRM
jgi:hypothetical protein